MTALSRPFRRFRGRPLVEAEAATVEAVAPEVAEVVARETEPYQPGVEPR